jgi:Flp pilus assembly protein TadG
MTRGSGLSEGRRVHGRSPSRGAGPIYSRGIGRGRGECGAIAPLELAIIAVPVLAVLMFIVLAGRVVVADGTLDGVAHYSAREAARARSAGDASSAAASAVDADMAAAGLECDSTDVAVDTANFRAGGTVAVLVTCEVRLSDLAPLPLPGTRTIQSRAVAAIDVYRGVR